MGAKNWLMRRAAVFRFGVLTQRALGELLVLGSRAAQRFLLLELLLLEDSCISKFGMAFRCASSYAARGRC